MIENINTTLTTTIITHTKKATMTPTIKATAAMTVMTRQEYRLKQQKHPPPQKKNPTPLPPPKKKTAATIMGTT